MADIPQLSEPDFAVAKTALDYELAVIAFESVQARMKLAIDIGDIELIDKIQPELAAAAAAVRPAKAPRTLN